MAESSDVVRRLQDYIVDELGWPGSRHELTADYPLIENDVLDSLGIFQLVSFVQEQYQVEIDDHELVPENFETIGALARLVGDKTS